jgi:uncharacterized protein YraI
MHGRQLWGLFVLAGLVAVISTADAQEQQGEAKTWSVSGTAAAVKSGPSQGSSSLGVAPRGAQLQGTGQVQGGFVEVQFNGQKGWVAQSLVSESQGSQQGNTWVVTASTLNVRSGPGTQHSIIGTLQRGTAVEVSGESGVWKSISVGMGSTQAWVHGAYLSQQGSTADSSGEQGSDSGAGQGTDTGSGAGEAGGAASEAGGSPAAGANGSQTGGGELLSQAAQALQGLLGGSGGGSGGDSGGGSGGDTSGAGSDSSLPTAGRLPTPTGPASETTTGLPDPSNTSGGTSNGSTSGGEAGPINQLGTGGASDDNAFDDFDDTNNAAADIVDPLVSETEAPADGPASETSPDAGQETPASDDPSGPGYGSSGTGGLGDRPADDGQGSSPEDSEDTDSGDDDPLGDEFDGPGTPKPEDEAKVDGKTNAPADSAFARIDANGDGRISHQEGLDFVESLGGTLIESTPGSVTFEGLSIHGADILVAVATACSAEETPFSVMGAAERTGHADDSPHYAGNAIDLSSADLSRYARNRIVRGIEDQLLAQGHELGTRPGQFEVIVEWYPPHIHTERK